MTGFDETVPPDDTRDDQDATMADNATDNVVKPQGAPKQTDGEKPPRPFAGDADIASGQYGPTADYGEG